MTSLYYPVGQELKVALTPWPITTAAGVQNDTPDLVPRSLQHHVLGIVRAFSPSTLSAVLCVKPVNHVVAEGLEEANDDDCIALDADATYILKLFDRRCMESLREDFPHNAELESQYRRYLERSDRTPIAYTTSSPDPKKHGYDESDHPAVTEDWINWYAKRNYQNEAPIYRRLMQDPAKYSLFPRCFGTVEVETEIGPVQGLLLEYISPAITLTQFVGETAPCGFLSEKVEKVCQDAVNNYGRLFNDYILNEDIRPDNILVRLSEEWPPIESTTCPSHIEVKGIVIIDFGHARLRHGDETDFEWRQIKIWNSEAGELNGASETMFEEINEQECPYHGTACHPAETRAESSGPDDFRVGPFALRVPIIEEDPFAVPLTADELEISQNFPLYGQYDQRPHPRTAEEARARWEQLVAKTNGGGSVEAPDVPRGASPSVTS